jgi:hypothetical protein
MGGYAYLTFGGLKAELLSRLQDPNAQFTSDTEAGTYLIEGLRALNALTSIWNDDYELDFNSGDTWKSLNVPGSPRERTVTDTDLETQMEAMLLEPMSGGVWTGTDQFNIDSLSAALQYRRDELLLESAANTVNLLQPSPLLTTRTFLPDSTLGVSRVRWLPVDTTPIYDSTPTPDQLAALTATADSLQAILAAGPTSDATLKAQLATITQNIGSVELELRTGTVPAAVAMPYVLGREDVNTANSFGPLLNIEPGAPDSWMVTANAPLAFDVSCPPNQPGTWDMLISFAGVALEPPASTVVGLPDDWTWVCLYGALADVLANSPEGRDSGRAKYCLQRYEQGKKAMLKLPWMLEASVASIPVDTPSYKEIDSWLQDWEDINPAGDPQIVVGGIDLVALAPFVTGPTVAAVLTVIGNAPIPVLDTDLVQLSRDGVDALLNYAQHVASFKMGGRDFALTMPLYQQFEEYCRTKNSQYSALGIFRPELLLEGNRVEAIDPRFEVGHGSKTR